MEVILNKIEEQLEVIDKQLEGFESLTAISKRLNIRLSLLSTISILSMSIVCFVAFGPSLLAFSNLIGCVYPMYTTMRMLTSHSEEEYVECMVYWMVFGLLYSVESLFTNISSYLPFFYPFKVSLLFACFSKETNFSKIIYENIFVEYFGFSNLSEAKKQKTVDEIKNSEFNTIPSYCEGNN